MATDDRGFNTDFVMPLIPGEITKSVLNVSGASLVAIHPQRTITPTT